MNSMIEFNSSYNNQSKIWWHLGKDNKSTGKFHYNFILNKLIDKYNEEFKEI